MQVHLYIKLWSFFNFQGKLSLLVLYCIPVSLKPYLSGFSQLDESFWSIHAVLGLQLHFSEILKIQEKSLQQYHIIYLDIHNRLFQK